MNFLGIYGYFLNPGNFIVTLLSLIVTDKCHLSSSLFSQQETQFEELPQRKRNKTWQQHGANRNLQWLRVTSWLDGLERFPSNAEVQIRSDLHQLNPRRKAQNVKRLQGILQREYHSVYLTSWFISCMTHIKKTSASFSNFRMTRRKASKVQSE